ncbi:hypothetical protein ACEN9J_02785 [Variovorax sp. Varisp41]|uniref:hypothetical protein n=1 Tax=Variovorax sp. Varisp41 TaxID=3243033 RepID=UPI0039B5E73D
MSKVKYYDAQKEADKEARRLVRIAYATGGTAPYSLSRLLELKISTKVIRAVYRAPQAPASKLSGARHG